MNPDRIVAGLDIGSAKTTAVIGEVVGDLPKHPSLKILGVGQSRTTGMRRGVVADIEETTRSIRKAIQDAERMGGVEVHEVYSGIAGEHVQAMTSKGIVAVSGDEIGKSDVDRANEVARAQAIPAERELLHAIEAMHVVDLVEDRERQHLADARDRAQAMKGIRVVLLRLAHVRIGHVPADPVLARLHLRARVSPCFRMRNCSSVRPALRRSSARRTGGS